MHKVAADTAEIVKKYRGSLSGEHGDGLLRSEFIPVMLGNKVYEWIKEIKSTWDPQNIFNPGKIAATPSMVENLRYDNYRPAQIKTVFRYMQTGSLIHTAEKCNGSADCRKNIVSGGVMCPTYMATGDENFTTRARANTIREYLTNGPLTKEKLQKIINVLSLCLSCKSCKSECPSGVDITKMKADLYQIYYDKFRAPLRNILIANIVKIQALASHFPSVYNFVVTNKHFSALIRRLTGFAEERKLPEISPVTWVKWHRRHLKKHDKTTEKDKKVLLFADEFTNYLDAHIGIAASELLSKLGYNTEITKPLTSGRTYLSKGFVRKAKAIVKRNIKYLYPFVEQGYVIVGIEPSAILTLRDEYLDLAEERDWEKAKKISETTYTIDEFLYNESRERKISSEDFQEASTRIILHTHCYQKVLSDSKYT
jgi:Fe-S oxidoreductase